MNLAEQNELFVRSIGDTVVMIPAVPILMY